VAVNFFVVSVSRQVLDFFSEKEMPANDRTVSL